MELVFPTSNAKDGEKKHMQKKECKAGPKSVRIVSGELNLRMKWDLQKCSGSKKVIVVLICP